MTRAAQRRSTPSSAGQARHALPAAVHEGLRSPSKPLDAATRGFFEPRLGHDFGRVRVHAEGEATRSPGAVQAQAYTVGEDVVFAPGRYQPGTRSGQRLLAHELTHVAQQAGAVVPTHPDSLPPSNAAHEGEAEQVAGWVMQGLPVRSPRRTGRAALARFSDPNHRVIEQAALPGSGLTKEQMAAVERGNMQRDYSQMPGAAVNALAVGQAKTFGGYDPVEHFDNFIFDVENDRWRTRGAPGGPQEYLHESLLDEDRTPIDYISAELDMLAHSRVEDDSMVHLGNALHTVEDFFAHSNFMELTRADYRFGKALVTGGFDDNPANSNVSLMHSAAAIATPGMRPFFDAKAEHSKELTEPRSHSHLAKDTGDAPGFAGARRLAALVVQELAADVVRVMSEPNILKRPGRMRQEVVKKIDGWLRPPDLKNRWWEGLVSRGGAAMDARIAEAEKRAPISVNHWAFSPVRNLEASKESPLAMPLGAAVPLGPNAWLQAGPMAISRAGGGPGALDSRMPDPVDRNDQKSQVFLGGAQVTGRF